MFPPKNIISVNFSCLLRILNLINEKVSPKGMGGGLGSLAVNTVFNPYLYLNNIILIDKIQTGDTELTKASRVQNCVHSNSFINDDIFVEKSQKCQSVHTFKPAKYLFTDTWVHYEDLILHFCKVSKPLEFITFQLVIHCF